MGSITQSVGFETSPRPLGHNSRFPQLNPQPQHPSRLIHPIPSHPSQTMSINDSSRTFNPAAQAQQQQHQESAPLQPTPTSTASAPQPTHAPIGHPTEHHQHQHTSEVVPGQASAAGVPQAAVGGGASSGSQVHDGLYPISAFVLKQGVSDRIHFYFRVRVITWTTSTWNALADLSLPSPFVRFPLQGAYQAR